MALRFARLLAYPIGALSHRIFCLANGYIRGLLETSGGGATVDISDVPPIQSPVGEFVDSPLLPFVGALNFPPISASMDSLMGSMVESRTLASIGCLSHQL